jgi:ABC-2 type transport system permease protein
MTVLRLLAIFFRLGAMNELQYRTNFWLQLVRTAIDLGAALFMVYVVYSQTPDLNGWAPAELVVLLGVWTLMSGLVGLVVQPGMERLIEDVREGTLDFTLTKPEESQVLVSISQVRVWRLVDVLVGIAVIAAALAYLGRDTGAREAATFAVTLVAGCAIIYSFWLMLSTVSFWFVRIGNILMVFHSLYEAAKWPVTIYPGWMRVVLTFVVPVAFAVTVPAGALVGRATGTWLLGTVLLSVVLMIVSRLFWRVGVRSYSGASA